MKHIAILNLYKNAVSVYGDGDAYDIQGNKIDVDESLVQVEVARLQAEYDAKEYQRKRAVAYPSIQDQLDTLYHGGYEAWKATITAVKEEFPKP